jgi:hypothetical protein
MLLSYQTNIYGAASRREDDVKDQEDNGKEGKVEDDGECNIPEKYPYKVSVALHSPSSSTFSAFLSSLEQMTYPVVALIVPAKTGAQTHCTYTAWMF